MNTLLAVVISFVAGAVVGLILGTLGSSAPWQQKDPRL